MTKRVNQVLHPTVSPSTPDRVCLFIISDRLGLHIVHRRRLPLGGSSIRYDATHLLEMRTHDNTLDHITTLTRIRWILDLGDRDTVRGEGITAGSETGVGQEGGTIPECVTNI
jgi:hypothetical protein